jgi:hypothetical protein
VLKQGILPFSYECEPTESGMTALAGLPAYLELASVARLPESIRRHLEGCHLKQQGWRDVQIILSLILLNIAGGDCVDDLRILENDEGLVKIIQRVGLSGHPRKERREQARRWRKECRRTFPSAPVIFRYLEKFVNAPEEQQRGMGKAFIPAPNAALEALGRVNPDLLNFAQRHHPQSEATLEMDASIIETSKQDALFSYKGSQSYQPLSVRWAEQDLVPYSQLRDGNVPASYENLGGLQKTLETLPAGLRKVYFKSDTAGYQQELLKYCAEGQNKRFGVIEFAVGVDVTAAFRKAVAEVEEKDWQSVKRGIEGRLVETGQEWAEVCFVPEWTATSKMGRPIALSRLGSYYANNPSRGWKCNCPSPPTNRASRSINCTGW